MGPADAGDMYLYYVELVMRDGAGSTLSTDRRVRGWSAAEAINSAAAAVTLTMEGYNQLIGAKAWMATTDGQRGATLLGLRGDVKHPALGSNNPIEMGPRPAVPHNTCEVAGEVDVVIRLSRLLASAKWVTPIETRKTYAIFKPKR